MQTRRPDPNRDRKGAARTRNDAPFVSADGPLAYLVTFPTYGTWLHGDKRGSVDRHQNIPDTPLLEPNDPRARYEQRQLKHNQTLLDAPARSVVHRTILEVADHRGWTVHALSVRTNHVHVVINGDPPVERIMNQLKSWSTRRLVEAGVFPRGTRVWVRHGSTRYLWKSDEVVNACRYVVKGQGPELPGVDA